MISIKAFIRKQPVLAYYALTFTLSWGAILLMIGLKGMPVDKQQMAAVLPAAIVGMLLGPSVSGLLMIGIVDGRPGFRELRARLGRWRVDIHWYAVALLLAPLLIMAVLMGLSAFSPAYLPGIFTKDDKVALLLMGLISGTVTGICEELGWTGFVTPKLRQRYGVLTTGLIIGSLWGIWHILPMAILPSIVYSTPLSPATYILIRTLNFLVGGLIAFRVLFLWVYERTQSLLVVMLIHISLTAANIIYEPAALGGTSNFVYDFVEAAVVWIIIAVIVVTNRGRLESQKVGMDH
jgi:uncharacterized protein